VTSSLAAPGDTSLSDATEAECDKHKIKCNKMSTYVW